MYKTKGFNQRFQPKILRIEGVFEPLIGLTLEAWLEVGRSRNFPPPKNGA